MEKLAKRRVADVATWKQKILRHALCALVQGKLKPDLGESIVRSWENRLDAAVDRIFFSQLWDDADVPENIASITWNKRMQSLAKSELLAAAASIPMSAARQYRNQTFAWTVFGRRSKKHFPDLFIQQGGDAE